MECVRDILTLWTASVLSLAQITPYMAVELGPRFKLGTALRQGMLPVVWAADDPITVLEAYNALYLQEEVQQENLVRNIGAFARFLQAMSFQPCFRAQSCQRIARGAGEPQDRRGLPANPRRLAARIPSGGLHAPRPARARRTPEILLLRYRGFSRQPTRGPSRLIHRDRWTCPRGSGRAASARLVRLLAR